jgi:hypothetical protein
MAVKPIKTTVGNFFKFSTVFPLACRIAWIKAVCNTWPLQRGGAFNPTFLGLGFLFLNFLKRLDVIP